MNLVTIRDRIDRVRPPFKFAGALLVVSIVLTAGRAYGDCPPNSEQSWVEETPDGERVHCKCLPGFVSGENGCEAQAAPAPTEEVNRSDSALTSQICATRDLIAADQKAIAALNFALTAGDFEEIGKLTEDRKVALQDEAVGAMFGAVLDEASTRAVLKTASLNPFNAQKYIGELNGLGVKSRSLNDAIRNIALVKGKPQLADAFNKFVGVAKSTYDGYELKDKDAARAVAVASIGIVGTLRDQSELGALATETNLLIALYYAGQMQSGIDQLNSMTNTKLLTLTELAKRLQTHVGQLNELKQNWAAQFPGSTPSCSAD